MDKNEQNLKIEELKTAMHEKDFEKAVEIADELDLRKLKDNNVLSLVADTYEMAHKYSDAKRVLLLAYENTNAGRQLAYRLCLIAVKNKEFDEAMEFYGDFVEMAPRDTSRYILRYKIAKAKGEPIEKLIDILEEYVNIDMEEKWAYELAKLYRLAGDEEKCVDICDEISLWFSEGKYVAKAMELKKTYRPLTLTQQEKYDKIKAGEISKIEIQPVETDNFNTMDIQKVIANEIQDIIEDDYANVHDNEKEVTKIAPDIKSEEIKEDIQIPETVEEELKVEDEKPQKNHETTDSDMLNDIKGVEDILRQLEKRGILKAETVNQAVNIMDGIETSGEVSSNQPEKDEQVIRNNGGIKIKTVSSPIKDEELKLDDIKEEQIEPMTEDLEIKSEELLKEQDIFADNEKSAFDVPVFDLSYTERENEDSNLTEKESTLHTQESPSAKLEILSGAKLDGENINNTVEEQTLDKEGNSQKGDVGLNVEEEIPDVEPGLTLKDEELTAFKNYLNVEGFESNIREVLQELIVNYTPNGKSADGNVMILGDEKTGKTTLAIEIIKLVNKKRGRRDRKLAKVNAEVLNRRGFRNSMNKLLGSDLIVENASRLGPMTISEVVDVSGMYTDDMLIILEGETDEMKQMLSDYPKLSNIFNHVIQIREYDIKEWVEYAKKYANQQGYGIDELANLACYKVIDDFFGANKGIGQSDVEEIIDQAIAHSKKLRRKLSGIFSSKRDEDGLYILVESDFNI